VRTAILLSASLRAKVTSGFFPEKLRGDFYHRLKCSPVGITTIFRFGFLFRMFKKEKVKLVVCDAATAVLYVVDLPFARGIG
jgi:hypothetical protein